MSEPKLISPMLDGFVMGSPISEHNGVCCCPAIENESDNKYIVKIISTPASQAQLDALLLSGAYSSIEAADEYFKALADEIAKEIGVLDQLSQLEGFSPYTSHQLVPMDEGTGYDVYLLSPYRKTLAKLLRNESMTHLSALNLALDICAALTICRRSGYLYVDLKPENIYLEPGKASKIGDIGFISLDSLRFASLPERYRSVYTAPEITDAFVSINTTIDVYALGLILYQIFNDGLLPVKNEDDPSERFAPPAYADYEMAEIILKACDADPENRWQDPVEMGQAIVAYMQRNGAHDTPIVPVSVPSMELTQSEEVEEKEAAESSESVSDISDPSCDSENESSDNEEAEQADAVYAEDVDGNLSFLISEDDETAPEQSDEEISYSDVSSDVSHMLQQADELISHDAPDPVVAPEPIDVPIPSPIQPDADSAETDAELETEEDVDSEDENDACEEEQTQVDAEDTPSEIPPKQKPKRKHHWLRNILIGLFVVIVAAIGFLFYTRHYLLPIDSITLKEHENGDLTVLIKSTVEESKLTVICSDIYGNQLSQPVVNGQAEFTGLAPDSAFTIELAVDGFHKLTGDTYTAFTTPAQTNIVQFDAATGSEDGSAILTFTIDGPDSDQWKISYSAADVQEQSITFAGHMCTITGLEIGKTYNFVLTPETNLNYTGTNEITHIASAIIKATGVRITSCQDGKLTAVWSAPKDSKVENWSVRCYNDTGYDKTVVVSEPSAIFDGVETSSAYTVEVIADGMSVSERAYAPANSVTITGFNADISDANKITLNWESNGYVPEKGWILMYSVDGSVTQEISGITTNKVELSNKVPGSKYTFNLQSADGVSALGGYLEVETEKAKEFSGYGVSAKNMEFKMCTRPSKKNWDRHDLKSSDYTTSFKVGKKASFLVHLDRQYNTSKNKITTLFVIRDENGSIVSTDSTTTTWTKMWYRNYCELDIPSLPQSAGKYTIDVYFNSAHVHTQSFKVSA